MVNWDFVCRTNTLGWEQCEVNKKRIKKMNQVKKTANAAKGEAEAEAEAEAIVGADEPRSGHHTFFE